MLYNKIQGQMNAKVSCKPVRDVFTWFILISRIVIVDWLLLGIIVFTVVVIDVGFDIEAVERIGVFQKTEIYRTVVF